MVIACGVAAVSLNIVPIKPDMRLDKGAEVVIDPLKLSAVAGSKAIRPPPPPPLFPPPIPPLATIEPEPAKVPA